jgi:hypothetical protein
MIQSSISNFLSFFTDGENCFAGLGGLGVASGGGELLLDDFGMGGRLPSGSSEQLVVLATERFLPDSVPSVSVSGMDWKIPMTMNLLMFRTMASWRRAAVAGPLAQSRQA